MHKKVLLIVTCIYFCNLFNFPCTKALIGEEVRDVFDDEFSFVAALFYRWQNGTGPYAFFCSAALVSNRDLITAQHCLSDKIKNNLRVTIGSREMRNGTHYSVQFILFYNQYANQSNLQQIDDKNEIAVIRLTQNVTDTIQPAAISQLRIQRFVGRDVSIAGWGKTANKTLPKYLQTATLVVHDRTACSYKIRDLLGRLPYLNYFAFCTFTTPYVLVDSGDSGAPVLYWNEIVGITISVCPEPHKKLKPEKVNLHAALYDYRHFIIDVIQNR